MVTMIIYYYIIMKILILIYKIENWIKKDFQRQH